MKPKPTITITFHGLDNQHEVWDVDNFDNLDCMLKAYYDFCSKHGRMGYEFGIED